MTWKQGDDVVFIIPRQKINVSNHMYVIFCTFFWNVFPFILHSSTT
jgi:hypothetical protein